MERKVEYCTNHLELNSDDIDVWNYKGTILSDLGRHREAVECHEKAALLIDDPSYFSGKAMSVLEDYKEAAKHFDDVLRTEPDHARAWLEKGSALVNLGRPEEAVVCLDKALRLGLSEVCEAKAWFDKGVALVRLGSLEEAIISLDKSLQIDPGNARAWGFKATILLRDEMRKYEEALACLNEVLEIFEVNPDNEIAKLVADHKRIVEQRLKEQLESKA